MLCCIVKLLHKTLLCSGGFGRILSGLLSLPSKLKMHVKGLLFSPLKFSPKKSPRNLHVIKAVKTLLELELELGCRL